jgi:hypothetical protein
MNRFHSLGSVVLIGSVVALGGCSGAATSDTTHEHGGTAKGPLGLLLSPLPIVVCDTNLNQDPLGYTGTSIPWDGTPFETSLENDLGDPSTTPWLLAPRSTQYVWVGYQLPTDYPTSVSDLVSQYATIDPVDSDLVSCTVTTLDANGLLLDITQSPFVLWDPRVGGTGG